MVNQQKGKCAGLVTGELKMAYAAVCKGFSKVWKKTMEREDAWHHLSDWMLGDLWKLTRVKKQWTG